MKLKVFSATSVFNFLDFEIKFNRKLSFLIGTNGSGKTTILRLIQALLTPSLSELAIIPFSNARIEYEDRQETYVITCTKSEKSIVLTVSSVEEELHFSPIDEDEINFIIADDKALNDFTKSYQSRHTDHPVFQFISRISAPIFLGLERAHRRTVDWNGDTYSAHLLSARRWNRSVSRGRRIFEGALTAGLAETQSIVEEAYRRIRISESRRSEQLRESILVSAFRYQELTTWPFSPRDGLTAKEEWERIQQRRAEIENALENIGVSKKKLSAEVGQFFQNLDDLFSSISASKDDGSYPIEWLMNKAQIDRVSELIEIIDENRVKVARLYSPINKFLQTLNSFYEDGGKELEVNEVGQLQFKRGNGMTVPIAALSSGERQLLIIFSHLAFNRYGDRSNVFIVDEPELSLHLRWQEQFVAKALEMREDVQLVMATHSPEIVGEFEKYGIQI